MLGGAKAGALASLASGTLTREEGSWVGRETSSLAPVAGAFSFFLRVGPETSCHLEI